MRHRGNGQPPPCRLIVLVIWAVNERASFAMIRLSRIYAGLFAAVVVLAAPAAQAFTIENGSANSGGSALAPSPFNDPTKKVETDKNGTTKMQFGNTSVYIGNQGSPERDFQSGMERMFAPLGRPGN
jgi:hypothetical protein